MTDSHNITTTVAQSSEVLARGLGWFSLGLGLVQVLSPQTLTRSLGMQGKENLMRFYGVREITTGIGILSSRNPSPWLWGRFGGDVLDLATLAPYAEDSNPKKRNVALAIGAVAGVAALDVTCAQGLVMKKTAAAHETWDYSNRSGFPKPAHEMRGAASDFEVPRDMRAPEAMRPYAQQPQKQEQKAETKEKQPIPAI